MALHKLTHFLVGFMRRESGVHRERSINTWTYHAGQIRCDSYACDGDGADGGAYAHACVRGC